MISELFYIALYFLNIRLFVRKSDFHRSLRSVRFDIFDVRKFFCGGFDDHFAAIAMHSFDGDRNLFIHLVSVNDKYLITTITIGIG